MDTNIKNKIFFIIIFTIFFGILIYSPIVHAQNWINLPPYNTLWPLWSPALSPIDDITGLPTPVVSSLTPDIVLPVSPGLTWDPSMEYPWLLYNTLAGMAYFDPFAGINLWPAPSLLDADGLAAPIILPTDFAALPPTSTDWLLNNIFLANLAYINSYASFNPVVTGMPVPLISFTSLLTPLDIIGPPLATPIIPPPILPIPTAPIPTLPLPTVPIPTLPVPTIPVPVTPLLTAPIPTAPLPTIPVPIAPLPTAPIPTLPVPTLLVGTAPVPTIPVPVTPLPTAPIPTAPLPTIPIPTAPLPTITVPTIPVPTAAVSGIFFPFVPPPVFPIF